MTLPKEPASDLWVYASSNRAVALQLRGIVPMTDKSAQETLGQRMARIRKGRGITQVELAERLGIGQPNVSDYERDVYRPNADFIIRVAEILKVSTDELLGFKRNRKDEPVLSRRLVKRLLKIQELPKRDQQAILRTIDAFLTKAS